METPYEQVNCFADFGIIAGSETPMKFVFYKSGGAPLALSGLSSYGCTFHYVGDEDSVLFASVGVSDVSAADGNVMTVVIESSDTQNLGDCTLIYRPYYVDDDGTVVRPGQGRLTVFKSAAISGS